MEEEKTRVISLEEYAENPEEIRMSSKAGKSAILLFSSLACIPAFILNFVLGWFLYDEFSLLVPAVISWIVGLVELQAFWILLAIRSKVPPAEEKSVTDGMLATAKRAKIAVVAVLILLFLSPFIYMGVVSGIGASGTRNSLVGTVFEQNTRENIYTEYEFVSGNKCIERTVVDTAYIPQITETEHKYSVKKTDEKTFRITIGGYPYEAEVYENGDDIDSFRSSDATFNRRSSSYDPISSDTYEVNRFISSYNAGMRSSGKTSGTDQEYINAAWTVVRNALKFPDSAVINSSKVLERDGRGMAIVYLDLSASNSFGAMRRETYYVCIQEVVGNQYKASNYAAYVTDESHLPYLKSANGYGVDPTAEKNKDIMLSSDPSKTAGVCTVNGKTLDLSVVTAPLMNVQLYTVGEEQHVVAVNVKIPKETFHGADDELVSKMLEEINQTITCYNAELDESQVAKVFSAYTGTQQTEPLFVGGGYILHAASDTQNYYYSVTYGRVLDITQENYWTPISLVGQIGVTGTTGSWNPTTTQSRTQTGTTTTRFNIGKTTRPTKPTMTTTTTATNGAQGNHTHTFTNYEGKPATCAESGYVSYKTCTCGYTDYQEIPAKGHAYAVTEVVQPSCEAEGYTAYQCSGCADAYKDFTAATGHNYSEATCAAPATCSNCGITSGIALPHTMDYTKCTKCDYTDFSCVAMTSDTFCYESWYYLTGSDGVYLEDGQAGISISANGECTVTFDTYSYTFTLVQIYDPFEVYDLHFECYMDGERLPNADVKVFFDQNRCDFSLSGGTLGFSSVGLHFNMP